MAAPANAAAVAAAFSPLVSDEAQRGLNYIHHQLFATWDPANASASWADWFITADEDGNEALRYTVAHLGYTAAIAGFIAQGAARSNPLHQQPQAQAAA